MVDGGIDRRHSVFSDAKIVSENVAGNGPAPATAHGTALASLLVGRDGDFHGAVPGAVLFAADAFGGKPAGGSADDIARALSWLAANDVGVVNISLAGPPDALLEAAVNAFAKRGGVIVAAVGNNGAASPPCYPAHYPGVASVTSVDSGRNLQLDANEGAEFAATGVDVKAARIGHGYADVTGTSYAVPTVAGQFALLVPRSDASLVWRAWRILRAAAAPMPQVTYGYLDPPVAPAISASR